MIWSHDTVDLDRLVKQLALPQYPALVIARHLEGVTDPGLRVLVHDAVLSSHPHHIPHLPGPTRTPFGVMGGRVWRMALIVHSANLLAHGRGLSRQPHEVALVAAALGGLAPGCSGGISAPRPLRVARALGALRARESARWIQIAGDLGRISSASRSSLPIVGGSNPALPKNASLVRLAAHAVDHGVARDAFEFGQTPMLPHWADPDLSPRAAFDEFQHHLVDDLDPLERVV